MSNIFDMENIDDLPEDLKGKMRDKKTGLINYQKKVINLFKEKNILTIDEIIVGLFRLHNIVKTRISVSSVLFSIQKKELIKRIDSGKYELINNT